ncbi:class III lanthionine synthetase LanKC [Actinospica sp. MGRD01-02]|uniref:Class III lanthionine synthetase LanKC n=1 Tax=Actinospica acidithermotolerans TaxID=2828514 RepID=A0A941IG07_9ACTN|nr:class III lanthionine synthetase LanKC [Actinospica acidithermotolerans]MBR7826920.1 class III lanthionine synthetase LanKC [Actinospica acidithermotolerans]
MFDVLETALADGEYYAPFCTVRAPGPRLSPGAVPEGWCRSDRDIWAFWSRPGLPEVDQGWKIHVSAQISRIQPVLDTVAEACFAANVPFKHVATRRFYLFLHHKHAPRPQAGKFCALYPPDTETARRLLNRLAEALDGEEGAYVLTDRRYRNSRTVQYRYGAFRGRSRLLPDGKQELLVRDGAGRDIVDLRTPAFLLPPGITDPFVDEEPAAHQGSIVMGNYEVVRVLQTSNAGGAYQARDVRSGRAVFLKEARAHNGYTPDGLSAQERLRAEHATLTRLHQAAPGLCPEPLEYFSEWEHEFLATEFVAGVPLRTWVGQNTPLIRADWAQRDSESYFADCRRILAGLDDTLGRLHALGYRFGDLSPSNVIVTPGTGARLVDFEMATPLDEPAVAGGTPGFVPSAALLAEGSDPLLADRFALGALALAMFANAHAVAERAPDNLALLRRDLTAVTAPPADLWARATAFYPTGPDREPTTPTPDEVDADPVGCLARLADRLAAGLLAMADCDRADWVFPPPPAAFATNTVCVGYGTAGVVHALLSARVAVPDAVRKRLRQDGLDLRGELPPGLDVGVAGIARVLAQLGHLDEANDLALLAENHPLTASCATLAGGRAGVGLMWLDLYRRTGDGRCLDRAAAAGDFIAETAEPRPLLGPQDARGLFHGRSGLALFLHRLFEESGEVRYLAAGSRLLHEELDRAMELPDGALSFPDNAAVRRAMPYYAIGSAGVGTVLTRYVHTDGVQDERFAAALPRIVADADKLCATESGLYAGLAGLAHFLTDHAELTGRSTDRERAVKVATGLLKYAVPHGEGVRFLGTGALRFSADLSSGSAGVLLAVCRILDGPGADLFA